MIKDQYTRVLSLDPGNEETGFVLWDSKRKMILDKDKLSNEELQKKLPSLVKMNNLFKGEEVECVGIEMISSYYMPVGQPIFDCCLWIGIFKNTLENLGFKPKLIFRQSIKMHHALAISKVNDSVINGILRQKYGEDNTQKTPNKLYWNEYVEKSGGAKYQNGDIWSAFAVATYLLQNH